MKKILIIGHSHIYALRRAAIENGLFDFYNISKDGQTGLSEIKSNQYDSVIFLIAGNYHNIFGLVKLPNPFDFYLPEKTDLPINVDATLLPVELVFSILKRNMIPHQFNLTSTLLEMFKKSTVYQIESPPPIPSEKHIREHALTFKEKIDLLGVSPVEFRYKLWRLHSKIVRENCQKMGVTFIKAPKHSQDSEGFLLEKYWNPDPTHGNALYGDLVLNQIRAINNIDIKERLT